MASFNLANVSEALDDVTSDESGISFAGLARKWETEEDGKHNKCGLQQHSIYASIWLQ